MSDPVSEAYIGELIPKGRESFVMGLLNAVIVLGYSAGPVIGGMIADKSSINMAFICMSIMVFAGAFLALFGLPSVKKEKISDKNPDKSGKVSWTKWKEIVKDKQLLGIIILIIMSSFCIGAIWTVLPILGDNVFKISVKQIGLLVSVAVFMNGIVSVPAGWLGDRFSKRKLVIIGGFLTLDYQVFFSSLAKTGYRNEVF